MEVASALAHLTNAAMRRYSKLTVKETAHLRGREKDLAKKLYPFRGTHYVN